MKRHWLKRIPLIIIGVVVCTGLGLAALRSLSRSWHQSMMDAKSVHELVGIVKGKGYRKFEKENAARVENDTYMYENDEGDLVQRYPGDENWLIYYEVERFSPNDEPMSSRLLENERKRVAEGKSRTAIVSKDQYDQINVGDRIFANYQRFSPHSVMIWGCRNESDRNFKVE